MIELRWVDRQASPAAAYLTGNFRERVLQYRTLKWFIVDGCFAPDTSPQTPRMLEWSGWQDVPVVKE